MTYTIDEIASISEPVMKDNNVNSAVVFGSYAKGQASDSSDIDIFVDSGLKGLAFFGLLETLTEALKKPVDLIDASQVEAGSPVEAEIMKDGIKIYER